MTFEKYPTSVNNAQNPCRAYGIMARDADCAIIIRRGPSDWVQLIRWQTSLDELEYGQWFKGRIYERRCDLSPDGNLFSYFARKKNRKMIEDHGYTYAWTAVSKPPYFTALALWPKGNCWNGGGVFEDATTIRLNHNRERLAAHPNHPPEGLKVISGFERKGEDFSIYPELLHSHSWEHVQDGGGWKYSGPAGNSKPERPDVWRKSTFMHGLSLFMKIYGSNVERLGDDLILGYEIIDEKTGQNYPIENATWADWDRRGRLVYIAKGSLLGQMFKPEPESAQVIADLNVQTPSSVVTPDWAKKWSSRDGIT